MKRRTNPTAHNSRPRISSGPGSRSWLFTREASSLCAAPTDEDLHSMVWDCVDALSDADAWIHFQTSFFPAMACAEDVANMAVYESEFLEQRGLSVESDGFQILLVKDGDPIAGCFGSCYTSPRVPIVRPALTISD